MWVTRAFGIGWGLLVVLSTAIRLLETHLGTIEMTSDLNIVLLGVADPVTVPDETIWERVGLKAVDVGNSLGAERDGSTLARAIS